MKFFNIMKMLLPWHTKSMYGTKKLDYSFKNVANYGTSHSTSNTNIYQNPIVHRCINLIAQNLANVDYELRDMNGTIVTNHPINQVLQRPNKHQDWSKFIHSIVTDILIHGNSYWMKTDSEIVRLNSQACSIKSDTQGNIISYKFNDYEIFADSSNLLHIKNFNPYNPAEGISVLSVVKNAAMLHDDITTHNRSMLANGGRVNGALIFKDGATHEELEDAYTKLQSTHTGPNNAGSIMVLSGNVAWQEMDISKDIDFNDGRKLAAQEIAMAFGIPYVILGMSGAYHNQHQEERLHWWEDSLLPMLNMILSDLNTWLLKDEQIKIYHNVKTKY